MAMCPEQRDNNVTCQVLGTAGQLRAQGRSSPSMDSGDLCLFVKRKLYAKFGFYHTLTRGYHTLTRDRTFNLSLGNDPTNYCEAIALP